MGGDIGKISMFLTEYFQGEVNVFDDLFIINPAAHLSKQDVRYILDNCPADKHGLFNKVVDLTIVNKLKDKYLNHNSQVVDFEKKIIAQYDIPNEYLFVWFRGTDKITENRIPQFNEFIQKVKEINTENLPIVVRTDSYWFLQELQKQDIEHISIHLTKLSIENKPVHQDILNKVSEEDFFKENGISKVQYLQGLLATTHIASKAKIYVATNSSINSWVIQQRGNFDNIYVLKNDIDFLFKPSMTQDFLMTRDCGLFSNINVFQRDIARIGRFVKTGNIKLILTEYFSNNLDVYPLLFDQDKSVDISKEELDYIVKSCYSGVSGLFEYKVFLPIVNKIRDRYLNHTLPVRFIERDILRRNDIPNDYFFAWFRGTDKITENLIPSFSEFIEKIWELNVDNLPVVIKTDSYWFTKALKNKFGQNPYISIPLVKLSKEDKPIHHGTLSKVSEDDFFIENGITKVQYLQSLLAITSIAAKAKIYLATNSNINTYVIQQRGNFDNVHVYRDDKNFLFQP